LETERVTEEKSHIEEEWKQLKQVKNGSSITNNKKPTKTRKEGMV